MNQFNLGGLFATVGTAYALHLLITDPIYQLGSWLSFTGVPMN